MTNKMKGCFMLICAAFVWGVAFVAQSVGMDYIKPCTFNGIRTLLGFLTLLPVIYFTDKSKKKNGTYTEMPKRDLIKGSIVCGTFLALASTVQTYGLIYTMAGKAGFITAMYVIFVPIMRYSGTCGNVFFVCKKRRGGNKPRRYIGFNIRAFVYGAHFIG